MSYKCLAFAGQEDFLSNIVHLSNVGSMLGQRRRRWPNIKTALDQCLVWVVSCNQFSGYINAVNLYSIGYCWPTLDRPRHARFEAEWFFKFGSGCIIFIFLRFLFLFLNQEAILWHFHVKLWEYCFKQYYIYGHTYINFILVSHSIFQLLI